MRAICMHIQSMGKKTKTYNRRDSQMVTHSSTSRPVQCLCMAERTGCPVFTDLWSYVQASLVVRIIENSMTQQSCSGHRTEQYAWFSAPRSPGCPEEAMAQICAVPSIASLSKTAWITDRSREEGSKKNLDVLSECKHPLRKRAKKDCSARSCCDRGAVAFDHTLTIHTSTTQSATYTASHGAFTP